MNTAPALSDRPAITSPSQGTLARLRASWRADFFSPKDLVRRALVLTLLFVVVHLAGLREFTSILANTTGSLELGWHLSAFLGLIYIFTYLAFVLLVPSLLIAAAFLFLFRRWANQQIRT